MSTQTFTFRAELAARLEAYAAAQGQTVEEALESLLPAPPVRGNWVQALLDEMAAADIQWLDEPDAVERSREHFERYLQEKWERTQRPESEQVNAEDSR